MDREAQTKVARTSRQRAEFYLKKGRPGRAFSHFLVALQLNPRWKPELKHLFASTLCTWGRMLESKGRYNDLFTCYEQAIDTFGDNEEVLNNLGAHLFKMGHLTEASNFFHQALDVNSCFLPAYRNLESVSNMLVERWHFRMLNDSLRNRAYREAIIKKVRQGFDTVLDIGTGTGILSLFAVEGGAKEVYACDNSPTMISTARDVLGANHASQAVSLLNKLSHDLTIPEDMPHRVSLVVTETLDAGLLGEHILQTLVHAWDFLLLPRNCKLKQQRGIVIPFGATIWVAPIECHEIARRSRLFPVDPPGSPFGNEDENRLDLSQVKLVSFQDEPYDTEDLGRVREGYRFLATPKQAMHIDFNNPKQMAEYLAGTREGCQLSMKTTVNGCVDAIAAWFKLQLDEDLVLSSQPDEVENKAMCWDQTVFPLKQPITVIKDQELNVKIACTGGKLAVTLEPAERKGNSAGQIEARSKGDASPASIAKCVENLASLGLQQSGDSTQPLPVSEEIVTLLNDQKWVDTMSEVAIELLQARNIQVSWNILDLSPFPLVGLTLLKVLTEVQTGGTKWDQLTCIIKDERDEMAIRHVAQANNIDNAHIECLREEQFENLLDSKSQFDVILTHLVDYTGELKETYVNYLPSLKKLLKRTGVLLPRHIYMFCSVVKSQWLAEVSRVIDTERTCGFRIAEFINGYQVSEHLNFWSDTVIDDKFSDVVEALNLSTDRLANSTESSLTIKAKIPINKSGFANAIVYWFQMQYLSHNTQVQTGGMESYANHSAILIHPDCEVKENESVELMMTCHQGLVHAGLQKIEE